MHLFEGRISTAASPPLWSHGWRRQMGLGGDMFWVFWWLSFRFLRNALHCDLALFHREIWYCGWLTAGIHCCCISGGRPFYLVVLTNRWGDTGRAHSHLPGGGRAIWGEAHQIHRGRRLPPQEGSSVLGCLTSLLRANLASH